MQAINIRKRASSNVVSRDTLREVQSETLETLASAVSKSYGPDGSTTAIRTGDDNKLAGVTAYTKDGHKILTNIHFNMPIEISITDDIKDITANTVKTVGDGTTSAVMLSNAIFHKLLDAYKKYNIPEKKLSEDLLEATKKICMLIQSNAKEVTLDDIYNIAYTSTDGNEEIANSIKDLYEQFGNEVYIDVGISNTENYTIKSYDGLTIDSGYFNTAFINNSKDGTAVIPKPKIYIFEDPIDTPEMMSFLEKIMYDNIVIPSQSNNPDDLKPCVVFSPGFGEDIRSYVSTYISFVSKADPNARPPFLMVTNVGDMDALSDLATLSGAKTIKKYIDPEIQKRDIASGIAPTPDTIHEFAGSCESIIADANTTKIIRPADMFEFEDSNTHSLTYVSLLESLNAKLKQLDQTKTANVKDIYHLRRRINSLKCCMVDFLIGGISYTDRDAIKDAVEDAVLNCRSAAKDGVGHGANFEGFRAANMLAAKLDAERTEQGTFTEDGYNIYTLIASAYIDVMTAIYTNYCIKINEDPEIYGVVLVTNSLKEGKPFNIRTQTYDDLVETSIKADQVVLDAISKIVGLMFKTNQYIVQSPNHNIYEPYV